jgi:hypothetical protein
MNQDKITELWRLSMNDSEGMRLGFTTQQHYFAALVAAAEREECARVCDGWLHADGDVCAAAIRARG